MHIVMQRRSCTFEKTKKKSKMYFNVSVHIHYHEVPKDHPFFFKWFWGFHSIIVVYMDPLGVEPSKPEPEGLWVNLSLEKSEAPVQPKKGPEPKKAPEPRRSARLLEKAGG